METVSVAELKARLSHYLREVRAGRSFTVTSRDIPVAVVGPWEPLEAAGLEVVEPTPGAPSLFKVMRPPEPGLPDGAELIRRDREAGDARLGTASPGGAGKDDAKGGGR